MAISIRETLTDEGPSGGAASVTTGAGTLSTDLLVAFGMSEYYNLSGGTYGPPTGGSWTERVTGERTGDDSKIRVWTKTAPGGATTVELDGISDEGHALTVVVLAGANTTDPVDASAGAAYAGSGTAHPAPSCSPTSSDAYLLCAVATEVFGGSGTFTPPSGMTERAELVTTSGGDTRYTVASLQLSASGATGAKSFTNTASNVAGVGVSIAINTASSGLAITPAAVTVDVAAGTATITTTVAVTPAAVTVSATPGTVTLTTTTPVTPAPVTVTAGAGTLTITTGAVDITPDPVTVTASPGTAALAIGVAPAGPTVTATPGTVTLTTTAAITPAAVTVTAAAGTVTLTAGGIAPEAVTVTATPGAVTLAVDVPLTGPQVSATPGTVTVTQGLSVVPDGAAVTVTPTAVVVTTGAVGITPDPVTVTATPGTATLDLAAALTGPTVTATPGTVTITAGAAAVTLTGPTVTAAAGTVTVTSGEQVAPAAVTVTTTAGTLTVTRAAAAVNWGIWPSAREYLAIRRDELARPPVACPNDGEPLRGAPGGELYCPWGDYRHSRDRKSSV